MKTSYLLRFETDSAIRAAIHQLSLSGRTDFETYSPYPLDLIDERSPLKAEELRPQPLAIAALVGGLGGGGLGYWMQYFTEVTQFPRMVSDHAQHSWPAFVPVTFEMTVLGAAISIFFVFFMRTRLPELNHPVFDVAAFERASQDQFFLELSITSHSTPGSTSGSTELQSWIEILKPVEVSRVPR